MPIYEYACACGNKFEVTIIRRSDEEEVRCPACQSTQVEKLISHTAPSRPARALKETRRFKKVK